jgi:hypothetical protein
MRQCTSLAREAKLKIATIMICGLIGGLLACPLPVLADQKLNYTSDAWLDARYDWVAYLSPNTLSNYLNYPTSGLHPIVNVAVNYRVSPRFSKAEASKQVHYEDLWYHTAQPIGCRKFGKLAIGPGWQGAIVVPDTNDAASNPGAIANTIVRLLLDVNLAKCTLVLVFAPPQLEQQICDQLGQFNFFRTTDDSLGISNVAIGLCISSGDIRDRTFLVFQAKK